MPGIKLNSTVDTIDESTERPVNLTRDSINSIWNSPFMTDFRLKKINGEYIKFCQTCYQEDALGVPSKRSVALNKFYDNHEHLIHDAVANNGALPTGPAWWELRFSSICNQACRMCIPQTSSMLREEFIKIRPSLPESIKANSIAAVNQFNSSGYLGDSKFFMDEFWSNVNDIKYLELHGGEPTADKNITDLLIRLVDSGHSKHIYLHIHSNIHALSAKHIELWNEFNGAWLGISIDAYGKENEYIRYGSKWSVLEKKLELVKMLAPTVETFIISSMTAYNCCSMDKLLAWIISFKNTNELHNLRWHVNSVINPDILKIEIVPRSVRVEAAKKIAALLDQCDANIIDAANNTIKMLESNGVASKDEIGEFFKYTMALDASRNQNFRSEFPHLIPIAIDNGF